MADETPTASLGDVVYWYPHGDLAVPPFAAVVTKVSAMSLCLNLFDPSSYNMLIRDGVKHVTDPTLRDPERREMGAWDFPPAVKRLRRLEEQFEALVREVRRVARPGGGAA